MALEDTIFAYPDQLEILPLTHPVNAIVDVPGSKSITNRALILAALARGTSQLRGALEADDTRVMLESLQTLGIAATREIRYQKPASPITPNVANAVREAGYNSGQTETATITVTGQGGRIPNNVADLSVGNSGTSIRFLTALCALGRGTYTLDGVARMRERPQADLLNALQTLGVNATSVENTGCPPLRVESEHGLQGGTVRLRAEASSQFLTALLMTAPYAAGDVRLEILGTYRPLYVEITRRMMAQWGVQVDVEKNRFHISHGQQYTAQEAYDIEPDASSASYFFAAAAVTGGKVTVRGLNADALQGDVLFATEVLAEMGCEVSEAAEGLTVVGPPDGKLRGVDRDMSLISDTALTLAAIAPFADAPTTIRNIAHTRLQECDRIAAVCAELRRMGVQVDERPDGYTVHPAQAIQPATVQTYHDHRVAMSFALVGLRASGIVIDNPACVAKTFPGYWQALEGLQTA